MTTTQDTRPQLTTVELPIKHGHRRAQKNCYKCEEYLTENAANLGLR